MNLEPLLGSHGFMQVEHPRLMWEVDAEGEPFLRMLGEMIAIGLARGNELAELTLSVANVTAEPDEEGGSIPAGDFVAISVRGGGRWADDSWRAGQDPTAGLLVDLGPAADEAGVVYAYARDLGSQGGAVTTFLPRLPPPG
jgi:hypothetical protein